MIPTLIGVTLLVFAVTQMFSPEQRASLYIRDPHSIDRLPEIIQIYHLNDPVYLQYFTWIQQILAGNLGWSQTARQPVVNAILSRWPATVELVMFSIPITILLGIYLGIKSAVHRDKIIDHVTRSVSIVGWSLPSFWLGIVLLAIFYGGFGLFPPGRLGTDASSYVSSSAFIQYTHLNTIDAILNGQLWILVDALQRIVLPTITLTTIQIALIVRVMRSSMLESLSKGYITTGRAKGLSQNEVINKHARRNALIPVITLSGLLAAGMLNGVVITETIFAINGVGRLGAQAAVNLDIPMTLGFAIFAGILFIVANLGVDLLYAYTDPRIRLE